MPHIQQSLQKEQPHLRLCPWSDEFRPKGGDGARAEATPTTEIAACVEQGTAALHIRNSASSKECSCSQSLWKLAAEDSAKFYTSVGVRLLVPTQWFSPLTDLYHNGVLYWCSSWQEEDLIWFVVSLHYCRDQQVCIPTENKNYFPSVPSLPRMLSYSTDGSFISRASIYGHSLFFTSRADRLLLRSKENFQVGHCRAGSTFTGPNYRTASHWATGMEPNRKSLRNISGSDCRPSNSDTVAKWRKCLSSCNIYRQQKQTPSCWGIYRNTPIGVLKILIGGFAML